MLRQIWFIPGLPALGTDWQWNQKLQKLPPLCRHTHSFWTQLLFDPHVFFCQHVSHVYPCIWHFENSSALLDTLKKVFFSLLCQFHIHLIDFSITTGKRFNWKGSTNPKVNPILPSAILSLCAPPPNTHTDFKCSIIFLFLHLNQPHRSLSKDKQKSLTLSWHSLAWLNTSSSRRKERTDVCFKPVHFANTY